jgi:AcrR family transcriptional regulator
VKNYLVKSRINKHGTQDERTAAARAKLLEATTALIAERGPQGFSLEQVGDRAEVSRSLARHHFGSRDQLLVAAVKLVVGSRRPRSPGEEGLAALLDWMRSELDKAELGDRGLRCLLTLQAAAASPEVAALVAQDRDAQVADVRRHLKRARVLEQVRDDIIPDTTATLLVAQLQGELLRLGAGGTAMTEAFLDLVRHALAPVARAGPRSRRPERPEPPPGETTQSQLF